VLNRAKHQGRATAEKTNKTGPLAIALMLCPGLAYLRGAGE